MFYLASLSAVYSRKTARGVARPAVQNDVIVVAANYRLDVYGWLALDELKAESPDGSYGNYGLHDQRMAMQWVQVRIAPRCLPLRVA